MKHRSYASVGDETFISLFQDIFNCCFILNKLEVVVYLSSRIKSHSRPGFSFLYGSAIVINGKGQVALISST